ncbi:MAG: class II aldolase/adducin family protein [Thermoflexales bacterium]|nr:class II aldolase/adducin family protein [Thermoflexales bacterium]
MSPSTSSVHSSSSNFQTERLLRDEIVRVGKLLYDRNLIVGTDGNISARLDARRVLCTPSGLCKGLMTADQLIVVDLDGNRVGLPNAANRHLKPTSEMRMHLEAYRRRPEVMGIVHAHPPSVIAASIAGLDMARCLIPEVIVTLGVIPTTQYATPSSEENVHAIREFIAGHDAIILQRHGTLVVGNSLTDAYLKTETVDQMARVTLMLAVLGKGNALPADQVGKLMEQRQALGLGRADDQRDFCAHCGVCQTTDRAGAASQADQLSAITARVLRELGR